MRKQTYFTAPTKIAGVIDDEDLSLLTNFEMPLWVANPPQINQREDNFLDSLGMDRWDLEQLSTIFKPADKEKIELWLAKKDDDWMMRFYVLLNEAKESHDKSQARLQNWLRTNWAGLSFQLVRVDAKQGAKHVIASQAYFAPEDKSISPPADIDIVKLAVYAKNNTTDGINQPAKTFLQNIGVKPFDDKVAIELRLKRYQSPPEQIDDSHYEDIKQFVTYLKKHPEEKTLFQEQGFILGVSNNQPDWLKATELCLDSPFFENGLAELFEIHQKKAIWSGYSENLDEDELRAFVEFAKVIDVMHKLNIIELKKFEAIKNVNKPTISWRSDTGSAIDYSIPDIEKYLDAKIISASKLVWNALIHAESDYGTAKFRPNKRSMEKSVDSQFIHHLKNHAWIPNISGEFCTPQAMIHEALRADFPFDDGNGLLTKIEFGKNARDVKQRDDLLKQLQDRVGLERQQELKRNEEQKNSTAQELGFDSASEAEEAARLTEELGGIANLREIAARRNKSTEQPEESVPNPERRRKNVLERSENAPSKESVMRERSIQQGIATVTAEAKAYLRVKYTNANHELVCQCCQQEMPFKIGDAYYFEAVQCLKKVDKHHIENHLALCPICAAMYKHARIIEDSELRSLLIEHNTQENATSAEIPLMLAGKEYFLRFVGTHFFDLTTVFGED